VKTFSRAPRTDDTFHQVPCGLCGGRDFRFLYALPGAVYHRCRSCGLVMQNPQPLAAQVAARYDTEYFHYERENEDAFCRLARMGLADLEFSAWEEEARNLGPFLDVGCATGLLLHTLKQTGWKVEGVEICKPSAEFASRRGGFRVHTRPLEELELPSASFGVVHLSHVIEHLNDPSRFCREVFRLLAPGGSLVMTTPNIRGFQSRLLGAHWRSAIPDHLFLFDPGTLTSLAEKAGFVRTGWKTWGGLAQGLGPAPVKRFLDRAVKPLGWGDVMILRFVKLRSV